MSPEAMIELTQRAYTLRLRGAGPKDSSWHKNLWKTHDAVNKGAKAFGDWLLTMRGGLSQTLAESRSAEKTDKHKGDCDAQEVKHRRIVLALSWLSVESEEGAPQAYIVLHDLETPTGKRTNWKTVEALRQILQDVGVPNKEVEGWVHDCSASLLAAIRDDAVWVNRRGAFDDAVRGMGLRVSEEDVWDFLGRFFSNPKAYLASIEGTSEAENDSSTNRSAEEQGPKDLVQNAGQWLSSRFGTGKGAQFGRMARVYERIAKWAGSAVSGSDGTATLAVLAGELSEFRPPSQDLNGILNLISGPGYKSATRNALAKISGQRPCTKDDFVSLKEKSETDAEKCKRSIGAKCSRAYANAILKSVESACGFTYLQKDGPARHWQFAVMLDHAGRRVSAAHTWIKRAEGERRRFDEDAEKIRLVPKDAKDWLDRFCEERSWSSGALEPYRIRRRAVEGWKEIVAAWSKKACNSEANRIAAARSLQDDPEIEKFGDIQLFEALAAENAACVWRLDGKPDATPLLYYAAATDAEAKKRRYKVPAYRHPDPLRHPVFCDFGKSRWYISFDVHEACKRSEKNSAHDSHDVHGLRMGLWDGTHFVKAALQWSCKRLGSNLNLNTALGMVKGIGVSRCDRLGRAAAGAGGKESVRIMEVFEEKDWNGRLQVPRRDLDALGDYLEKCGDRWDAKASMMRDRLRWLVSFSPRLRPFGPWVQFASKQRLRTDPKYWPHAQENKKRQRLARLVLARLHGVRVLSVDLGHRYAAACAVWETLSAEQVLAVCRAADMPPPEETDLYLHLKRNEDGVQKTTIYRRVAGDTLSGGSFHPAPWARLDRQFLIKLQGEVHDARKASSTEIEAVEKMEREVGFHRSAPRRPAELAVDELMSEAVTIMRKALRRHTDCSRIAFNLIATKKLLPGGREEILTSEGRAALLAETLVSWRERFGGKRWSDEWAEKQWHEHIRPLLDEAVLETPQDEAEETAKERKKRIGEWREKLRPLAERLSQNEALLMKLHVAWATRWRADDGRPARTRDEMDASGARTGRTVVEEEATGWHRRLRSVANWLSPRGVKKDDSKRKAIRHVGGLSLTRIATFKSFYQLQKAFHMRAEPDDMRKNIPQSGDASLESFGQRALDALERMRENRVKQLASRIVEAALGIGIEKITRDEKDRKRPSEQIADPRFAPCHAVVIENLTHYRPEETRTRRENRQLMNWSSGKVKKYLTEACQLHGLHLREVSAGYTSRQDSRTGAPGIRCTDMPVGEFLASPRLCKELKQAKEKSERGRDAYDRYLLKLDQLWSGKSDEDRKGRFVRIPARGGEVFVSASTESLAAKGLQADLNAAANIGLKALMDPDWPGSWWYIPCDELTKKPLKEKVAGCDAIDCSASLVPEAEAEKSVASNVKGTERTKRQTRKRESLRPSVVNLWRNPCASPISQTSDWQTYPEYRNKVQAMVIELLTRDASSV